MNLTILAHIFLVMALTNQYLYKWEMHSLLLESLVHVIIVILCRFCYMYNFYICAICFKITHWLNKFLQKKVLSALEEAGVFTSGGLVKDKVVLTISILVIDSYFYLLFCNAHLNLVHHFSHGCIEYNSSFISYLLESKSCARRSHTSFCLYSNTDDSIPLNWTQLLPPRICLFCWGLFLPDTL